MKKYLPELEIIKLYSKDRISSPKIALKFNVCRDTIMGLLKRNNVKIYPKGFFMTNENISDTTREKLRKSHLGKKLSEEHRLKNIETLRNHKLKVIGKTRIEAYGKKKAEEWRKNHSLAIKGEKNYWFGKKQSKEHKSKISKALKGKMPKNLGEINKNKKGKGNPMYGRVGKLSPQYIHGNAYYPYSSRWNKNLKNKIRKRDNQICMNCGIHRERLKTALHIHHMDYNKKNPLPPNLISLCHKCHMLTRINREYWHKLFQDKLSKLYGYNYNQKKEIILDVSYVRES